MSRPSNALKRFAKLYVSGPPHIRGQWNVAANGAGLKEIPDRNDALVRNEIQRAGGAVVDEQYDPPAVVDELDELAAAMEADPNTGKIDFKAVQRLLPRVLKSIATGEIRSTPQQVTMIKWIAEQAEKQAGGDNVVHNVVVLPVQGSGATLTIDEAWLSKLRNLETKDAT